MFVLVLLGLVAAKTMQVMMPLTTVNNSGSLSDYNHISSQLQELAEAGVDSVMIDVWWGIVEKTERSYNFSGYRDFFELAKSKGLMISPVMSFHRCGGNVGDDCNIPLPQWVQNVANAQGYWYRDGFGNDQTEYISLSADSKSINGRKVLQIYEDFMEAFANEFASFFQNGDIYEVQIGLGPAGELRYPSYPSNLWTFPGVGAFQCFDSGMLSDFQQSAKQAGHSDWTSPPTDAGSYNSRPENTTFFTSGYKSEYGKFFLSWYTSKLYTHGEDVLTRAKNVFSKYNTPIVGKIAGIHWWYGTSNHAAELTAGYYNTNGNNAYSSFAKMFKKTNATFDFTCLEMRDTEQDAGAYCKPEELVQQVEDVVKSVNWVMSGENALERYDRTAYEKVLSNMQRASSVFDGFTYLRLTDTLINSKMSDFKWFVDQVHAI